MTTTDSSESIRAMDLVEVDLLTETVRSARLLLRPWQLADAEDVALACQDPLSQRWLATLPSPYTLDDARHYVQTMAWTERRDGTGLPCAMVDDSGRLAGSIDIHDLHSVRGAEIGYWVAPWARGNSYAAEATDALCRWAFGHGLHRVSVLAATGNLPSQRAAERAGFCREGLLRGLLRDRDGAPRDSVIFGRLATDDVPPP